MKEKTLVSLFSIAVALNAAHVAIAETAFTYQGKLVDDCCPATGYYDLIFKVFDSPGPGTAGQQGGTLTTNRVAMTNGLFTVYLNFDPQGSTVSTVFTGARRWLQIEARTNNALVAHVTLLPRTEITATPYALHAAEAAHVPWSGISGAPVALTPNMVGSVGANPLELKVNGSRALRLEPNANGAVNVIGGSANNMVSSGVAGATIAGGGSAGYTEVLAPLIGFLSTGPNKVLADFSAIGGGANNVISNDSTFAVIGGGVLNFVKSNSAFASIGGGFGNTIHSNAAFSSVAGGLNNSVFGAGSVIGGGGYNGHVGNLDGNVIRQADASVIGGGVGNTISAENDYAVIGGGWKNWIGPAGSIYSVNFPPGNTIGGGVGNTNSGAYATIPGGAFNDANGFYSFAAGRRAKAVHDGTFVWADSTDADFASTANNQLLIRASGGVGIGTARPQAGLHVVREGFGYGISGESGNIGIYARNSVTGTEAYLAGQCCGAYLNGNLRVVGTITKNGGSFKIDHPLDPANKYLSHSFVESPDMKNIYDGVTTLDGQGEAVVDLPDWFEVLNKDFRYQLTSLNVPGPNLHIAQKVKHHQFKIAGGAPGQEVSWQVTGIRQDAWANAHRIPVEENKPAEERGTYLNPEVHGQSEAKSVRRVLFPEVVATHHEKK